MSNDKTNPLTEEVKTILFNLRDQQDCEMAAVMEQHILMDPLKKKILYDNALAEIMSIMDTELNELYFADPNKHEQ